MRKSLVIILFLTYHFLSFSQSNEFMLWTKIGAGGKVAKKLSWAGEFNARMGRSNVETFFPQVGLEYKLLNWFKPSVEYRYIVDKNKYGNYKSYSRLNFNLGFKKSINQFGLGLRIRYQYAFNRIGLQSYNPDFDQAFRFKPAIEYRVGKSIYTPFVSSEFFYDPQYGPYGPGVSKLRLAVGTKLNLKGPHEASVKYQFDKKFHDYVVGPRHVVAISYTYKIK